MMITCFFAVTSADMGCKDWQEHEYLYENNMQRNNNSLHKLLGRSLKNENIQPTDPNWVLESMPIRIYNSQSSVIIKKDWYKKLRNFIDSSIDEDTLRGRKRR